MGVTRRGLLNTLASAPAWQGAVPGGATAGLPSGQPLRVQPVLVWQLAQRRERASWRPYGGLATRADVEAEAHRIGGELATLSSKAEFPLQFLPLTLVSSAEEAAAGKGTDSDALLLYPSSGPQTWLETLAASGKPAVMFLRHRSGPLYLYYEIAHFRFLRKSDDAITEPNLSIDDIVVDEYPDVLWRLRALYGLKNTRGTRSLAIGGLRAYTATGQKAGPTHARDTWEFDLIELPEGKLAERLAEARGSAEYMRHAERQAEELLAQPQVKLETGRRFVVNSFIAANLFKQLMREANATNLGVANCMGSLIAVLDTPPCLVLSLLNDEGYTAFCHTDYTQTPPGVLLRWVSSKPSFISNSHFPHHGLLTIAHCATPRRMDGRTYEPTRIMTHFESDYGAATRVEFRKGQALTNLIPNFACTAWYGFKGEIVDTPSLPMCRSQIDMKIAGDWQRLLRDMQGFHVVTCYGDYLREAGYAARKAGLRWENLSA